ncbi:MAG: hypothetical protein ACD_51C00292G0004 [uncultured bacterium]|nr:MAG: hypothetical protein ACD_51C00292G0004 [uncultured bacterium]KKT02694.1 MAG: hypothetical protein UV80_C0002G0161 [Candidatus Peregrinibacteria bacterium GW2011_GWF2_43_17]KKT20235.1 MAG: hypothetical protein UW03_C0007G0035 [Candidatus Peregrinibacteria bacterium GW2011_GWA2_43_8]HAU39795.1 hypothetical protein [Candidatus Peregrinibacteria bacterium]
MPLAEEISGLEEEEALTEPEAQALDGYRVQLDNLRAGNKPEWEVVQGRLLANGKNKLKLAMALEQTVIFGVDASEQILFSDGGNEVPECTKGKNYSDTMTAIKDKYELFDKTLMRQWETATGKHFVNSTWSWLTSARCAYFSFSDYRRVSVEERVNPKHGLPYRGARRMLRV